MNVWKMNLKDNRDEKPENLKQSKFDFCKKKGILGIGWANHGKSENATTTEKEIGYERAKNSLFSFKINDLVWVKNPATKEYYLCRIKSQAMFTKNKKYIDNDISVYCKCEYMAVGKADNLPAEITIQDLISISTISEVKENVSNATLSLYNSGKFKVCTNPIKEKVIGVYEMLFKKHKKITVSILAIFIALLTISITMVNIIHNGQKKETSELLTNQIFVDESDDFFFIMKFNDKGEKIQGIANYSKDKKSLKSVEYDSYEKYEIKISFFGKRYLIDDLGYKYKNTIKTDKGGNIVSIDSYVPINEDIQEMLNNYYKKLEDEEKEKKKKENEAKEIKSYIPNKDEFYKRVLQVFPEVNNWQLFGNSKKLYMDPYNNKNFCNLSENPILIFSNGNNRIAFMKTEKGLMISANGGIELTSKRYEQLIKLAFGNAPDELKICNLETFKKLTDTEEKAYPSKHSVEYKGITYEWNVGYKNGEQSGYTFSIKY